jgi:hypothetical protein
LDSVVIFSANWLNHQMKPGIQRIADTAPTMTPSTMYATSRSPKPASGRPSGATGRTM